MQCEMASHDSPPEAVAKVRLEWLLSDGTECENVLKMCAPCLRSKREEFIRPDDRFTVIEEYDGMLEAVAAGTQSDRLEWTSPDGMRFRWEHGQLIDVYFHHTDTVPIEAIDARQGVETFAEFKAACEAWLAELDDHDRLGYAEASGQFNR